MKRICILATAVVVALSVLVGAASAVAAPNFVASKYPAIVEGEGISEGSLIEVGSAEHFRYACITPHLVSGKLSAKSSEPLVTSPSDSTCGTAKLTMNGCKLSLRPGTETTPGVFPGTIQIGPAGCGPINITDTCQAQIPAQIGLAATFENFKEGGQERIRVTANMSGLTNTINSLGCGNNTYHNGLWKDTWKLSAKGAESGEALGLHLEKVGSPPAKLEAESYAAKLAAEQQAEHHLLWNFPSAYSGKTQVECGVAKFHGEISAVATVFPLAPEYSECVTSGSNTTVIMNSCTYTANVSTVAAGTVSISCTKEGDMIELSIGPGICTVKLGPQTLSGVTFANEGSGYNRRVAMGWNATGVKYTAVDTAPIVCPFSKTASYSDGTYSGTISLQGETSGGLHQPIEIRD